MSEEVDQNIDVAADPERREFLKRVGKVGVYTAPALVAVLSSGPAMAASLPTTISTSDRRLKNNVEIVGQLKNGLDLYRFSYNGNDTVFVGVMAQDVLAVLPEAVLTMDNGFYAVRYDLVGFKMCTFAQWLKSNRLDGRSADKLVAA